MSVLLFPFKLVFGLAFAPLRVARLPMKLFGFRGTVALAIGVGVGLVLAPRPGVETRQMLRERFDEWQGARNGAADLATSPAA